MSDRGPAALDVLEASHAADTLLLALAVPAADPSGLLAGHYPGDPLVPGIVLIDAIGAALARLEGEDAALGAIEGLRLQRRLVPGDRISVEAERIGALRWRVRVAVAGAAAARFVLVLDRGPSASVRDADGGFGGGQPLSPAAILTRLPHRAPMLLVDRASRCDAAIEASYAVTAAAPWFARLGRPPANAALVMPRALMLESFLQASGLLFADADAAGASLIFSGAGSVRFHGDAVLGDTLRHRLAAERMFDGAALLSGTVAAGGRVLATVTQVLVALRPPAAAAHPTVRMPQSADA